MTGERAQEPREGSERALLLAWLAFHRGALEAKCTGLRPEELVEASVAPSALSLLGLVRHMTEMERVYLVYALGGGELAFVYGTYDEGAPAPDFDELEPAMVEQSFQLWHREREAADELIAGHASLDEPGAGNRLSVRWNLLKVILEYARHNGHADLVRESIDGATGE